MAAPPACRRVTVLKTTAATVTQIATAMLLRDGYPAYTTTPGWLGYSDEKLVRLSKQAVADGFTQIKLKVGADVEDDVRRMRIAREVVGPEIRVAVDANQRWDVAEAIEWMSRLAPYDPSPQASVPRRPRHGFEGDTISIMPRPCVHYLRYGVSAQQSPDSHSHSNAT